MERPIMSFEEKKKSLIARSAWIIVLIFVVNYTAMTFFWYSTIWWFDMPMHFLGGFWLGLTGLWAYYFNRASPRPGMSARGMIISAVIITLAVGLGWELFEIAKDRLITGTPFYKIDTWSDLCFDLAGGLYAALFLIRRGYAVKNYS